MLILLFLKESILGASNVVLPKVNVVIIPQDGQDRFAEVIDDSKTAIDLTPSIDLELADAPKMDLFPDGDFSPASDDSNPTSGPIVTTTTLEDLPLVTTIRRSRLENRDINFCQVAPCLCNFCIYYPLCCDPLTTALIILAIVSITTIAWLAIRFRDDRHRKLK